MKRILSLDYGEKKIGVAISDPLHVIAKPFDTLLYKTDDDLIKNILNISETNIVSKIIVGICHVIGISKVLLDSSTNGSGI